MSRAERMAGGPAALFAYGTLRFDEVLAALLDRMPTRSAVAAAGWRAAALAGRVYPGLVRADAEVTGMLFTGLTPAELRLIDEYEAGPYELELLTLSDGRQGWTYSWTDQAVVLPHDWSPGEFAELHLADFAGKCRAWRDAYEAAGRTSRGVWRPHDPGPDSADRTRPEPGPLSIVISGAEHVGELSAALRAEAPCHEQAGWRQIRLLYELPSRRRSAQREPQRKTGRTSMVIHPRSTPGQVLAISTAASNVSVSSAE